MNIETGREFDFTNPQDDPNLYPTPPPGFRYDLEGHLTAMPTFGLSKHERNRYAGRLDIIDDKIKELKKEINDLENMREDMLKKISY